MKHLMIYSADVGSLVINGIWFNNGIGDGVFDVYYSQDLPEGYTYINDCWIDLRVMSDIIICATDTDRNKYHRITPERLDPDFPPQALRVARNNCGSMCLVKYF